MWQVIAAIAITLLVVSYANRPKPQSRPRPSLEDLEAPTAEEGREIPVLFGCRNIKGPNIVWYGDLRTTKIKAEGGKK